MGQSIIMTKNNMITVACRTRYTLEELQLMLEKYSDRGTDSVRVPLPHGPVHHP